MTEYLYEIGKLVKVGLSHEDPRAQEKYLWLHEQYVAAIELVASLPPDNAYRLENPELCAGVEALSKYDALVRAAQEAVATHSRSVQ